jgi:hypothetical protein
MKLTNISIPLEDIFEMIHYFAFPAVCYFSLKRDCQYWSVGVDQDEEDHMLQNANEVKLLYFIIIYFLELRGYLLHVVCFAGSLV